MSLCDCVFYGSRCVFLINKPAIIHQPCHLQTSQSRLREAVLPKVKQINWTHCAPARMLPWRTTHETHRVIIIILRMKKTLTEHFPLFHTLRKFAASLDVIDKLAQTQQYPAEDTHSPPSSQKSAGGRLLIYWLDCHSGQWCGRINCPNQ